MGQKTNGLMPDHIEQTKVEIVRHVEIYEEENGSTRGVWKGLLQNNRPVVRVGPERKHVDVWNFLYNTKNGIDINTPHRGVRSVSPRDVTMRFIEKRGTNITGRPPKYSQDMLKAFESALELTGRVGRAAKIVGIKTRAMDYYVNKHPFLKEALKRGKRKK